MHHDGWYARCSQHESRYPPEGHFADARVPVRSHDKNRRAPCFSFHGNRGWNVDLVAGRNSRKQAVLLQMSQKLTGVHSAGLSFFAYDDDAYLCCKAYEGHRTGDSARRMQASIPSDQNSLQGELGSVPRRNNDNGPAGVKQSSFGEQIAEMTDPWLRLCKNGQIEGASQIAKS